MPRRTDLNGLKGHRSTEANVKIGFFLGDGPLQKRNSTTFLACTSETGFFPVRQQCIP